MKFFALKENGKRQEYVEKDGKIYKPKESSLSLLMKVSAGEVPPLGEPVQMDFDGIVDMSAKGVTYDLPLQPKEIWGSGISYFVSRTRYSESDAARIKGKTIYETVYDAERPEIFFKGTTSRCAPPGGYVAVRSDSKWTLPEPELAVVIDSKGKALGYTIFDDVSARDIEAENPLYLPESKIYNGCCCFGPVVVTPNEIEDPYGLEISMKIYRNNAIFFEGSTSTKQMKTKIATQIKYLIRDNFVPDGTILTTGTSIIPGKEQGLKDGDRVEITIEKLGTLITGVIKNKN